MKTILIVSTESYTSKNVLSMSLGLPLKEKGTNTGKSILALGLGLSLKERGIPFAYMKPISVEVSYATGEPIDRDVEVIRSILGLKDDLKQIAPVPLEGPFLRESIESGDRGFRNRILDSFQRITQGRQVALVEGRHYLGLGASAGFSDFDLAQLLDADVLLLTRYDGETAIDRILCALRLFAAESRILGVVLNEVSFDTQFDEVNDVFVPFLADRGVEVLGIVPYDHRLRVVPVEAIVERLGGTVVTSAPLDKEVAYFLIGATGPETALRSFRRTPELAVITSGDRPEIQEAALNAPSLRCLILTGNGHPNRAVIQKANDKGIPVIVVGQNPMTAAEMCEGLLNHSRIRRGKRLDSAVGLLRSNVDIDRILAKAVDH